MKMIKEAIETAIKELGFPAVEFSVEHPKDENHGDYSSNIAMAIFAKSKIISTNNQTNSNNQILNEYKSPRELAEKIVNYVTRNTNSRIHEVIEKIEVAGAGFINFYLKAEVLRENVEQIVADKWEKPLAGKKYAVEYTDPNPFKEFHLGHLYSNLIGESIARMYEAVGATVWRGDFYGDVGMHIAKSVWGMRNKMHQEGVKLTTLEKKSIKERQQFMGQGYAMGVKAFEGELEGYEQEKVTEEIKQINTMVYVASQEVLVAKRGWKPLVDYRAFMRGSEAEYQEIKEIYQAGLAWSLAYFETYYARLGTKFDGYYPESWVGELGLKEVEKGLEKGVLELGEGGAIVFHGEKYGYHTRVFRNAMGLPTYEAKDLGLVQAKYQDFPFDYSLNVFGKEIDEYYKVVKTAMELIDPEKGKKQEHLAHGMVNLPEGKMSSRKGNVITVEWLLNEARDQAKKLIKSKEMSEEQKGSVAEAVGQAAVKFALLKSSVGDNVTFDFGQSVTFEGTSGPYIQYTYARAKSVLRKAKKSVESKTILPREVLTTLSRYGEVVAIAAREKSPSTLAMYLYELAQRFNAFYNGNKIGEDSERLWLTSAVASVLSSGLDLLGIVAPEEM